MQSDMERVNARVADVAKVEFPVASALVSDIVRAGGKRLRPLLLLLAGRSFAYEERFELLVTAAAGIELLHTASLVHDDTVDRAAIRRGKPTLNSVLSTGAVILIGDYLFAQSAMLAAATQSPRAVSIFAATLGDICDGQLREIFDAHRLDQSRTDYERRIYGKTASLFAGSAEMGAVLAGAPEPEVQALRQFGVELGMAFQIVDDLLDVTGGEVDLGKPAGNDLRQGTVTLPVLLYASDLDPGAPAWQELQAVISGDAARSEDVDRVLEAIRASDAIEASRRQAAERVDRAKRSAAVIPDAGTRDLLYELADLAVSRQS
jgi:geranylgeranyl pyrophosphate synthase